MAVNVLRTLAGPGILSVTVAVSPGLASAEPANPQIVQGMTISCQTWGYEWATDGFVRELEELAGLGVNWISVHPYAGIRADGSVVPWQLDKEPAPAWITRPIREAQRQGFSILVKPHLAYWGSPFSWRGEIQFADLEKRRRFFATYQAWIERIAEVAKDADAFAVGTELDAMLDEASWRRIIAGVRARTSAHLTYAANWTDYDRVPFWDALDAIGVQAYFPLSDAKQPTERDLVAGWVAVIEGLRRQSARFGKPVIFTELGYAPSPHAAREPWQGSPRGVAPSPAAIELQSRCFRVALEMLVREREWLRGAFLWKWFVGDAPRANFMLDRPHLRELIASQWRE